MGSRDDYCSISIITARACTVIRKRRSETCSLTTCISPRWIFSRWFETGEKNKGAQKVNQLQYGNTRNKSSKKKTNEENSLTKSSTALEDPGGEKKAECMKLGIGFGLIYLFNATKNELNRIVEIRREMEILLHNSKMELQNQRSNPSDASNLRTKISHYDSDCVEQFACSSESGITCSHDDDHPLNCKGNERNLEMNQLEAELQVELERLQFQLDSDVMLKYSTQHDAESSGGGSHSTSNPDSCVPTIENCGVSAEELRRRLHELIQTRQEERIKKLELALESTMQQLAEKEKEVLLMERHCQGHFSTCSKSSITY